MGLDTSCCLLKEKKKIKKHNVELESDPAVEIAQRKEITASIT